MARIDNAEAIRDRAYAIWEREGRPAGREHEHWAEAARDIESPKQSTIAPESAQDSSIVIAAASGDSQEAELPEMDRLRRALYEPAEFTGEALDDEPFLTTPANDTAAKKPGRRATR